MAYITSPPDTDQKVEALVERPLVRGAVTECRLPSTSPPHRQPSGDQNDFTSYPGFQQGEAFLIAIEGHLVGDDRAHIQACRSVPHTAVALTRIRTSSGPGSGMGTRCNAVPGRATAFTIAFISTRDSLPSRYPAGRPAATPEPTRRRDPGYLTRTVSPPSTVKVVPVIYLASSEARKSAAWAVSQPSPCFPMGHSPALHLRIFSTSPP
jgi:hypothetical protein